MPDDFSQFAPAQGGFDQFKAVKPPKRMSLAEDPFQRSRSSEIEEPPSETMKVGPVVHKYSRTGTSTKVPTKQGSGTVASLDVMVENMPEKTLGQYFKKALARQGVGLVKGVGFGTDPDKASPIPEPIDAIGKIAGPLIRTPKAAFIAGEAFAAPETVNQLRKGNFARAGINAAIAGAPGAIGQAAKTIKGRVPSVKEPSPESIGTGRFAPAYNAGGAKVGHAIDSLAVASDRASLEHTFAKRNVLGKLNDTQRKKLGELLVSENLRQVNPDHPQILADAEVNRIISDPAIAKAYNAHIAQVDPHILKYRMEAGMAGPNEARKGFHVSLIPEEKPTGTGESPLNSVASQLRRKKTRFANPASGTAELYSTDLDKIYETSFQEALPKSALRNVYAALKDAGKLSDTPQEGYKAIEIDKIPIEGEPGQFRVVQKYVPNEVASAIEDARNVGRQAHDPAEKALAASQRLVTGLALTGNPSELASHMHRQTTVLSKMPPVNAGVVERIARPLVNSVSAGTNLGSKGASFARILKDDMSTLENQQIMRDLMSAGGGTSRAFRHYTVSDVPVLGKLQSAAHDLLFSIPEGKGIKGYDMRVRVQMEKIRRQVEGNTDPQRIRDFANQLGQYTDKPLKVIERLKFFNPYLASQMPMRVTEFRQLLGGTGLKASGSKAAGIRAEALLNGIGTTIVGFVAANKTLSGKYPWENAPGHEFDLNTGKKDKKGADIYVKGNRALSPNDMRALQTSGIPDLIKEKRGSEKGKADYVSAGIRGVGNAVLSTVAGSPRESALAAAVGKAPFLTKAAGRPIDILSVKNKPPKGRSQGMQNLIDAVKHTNPAFENIPTGEKHNLKGQADLGNGILQYLFGQYTSGVKKKR